VLATGSSFQGIASGMVLGILGFVGFSSADALGREAKEPYKAIPRAIMWSALGVGVLYVFAAYTQIAVLGDDLARIAGSIDFYGVNFYNPTTVTAAGSANDIPFEIVPTPGAPVTGFGPEWPIVPSALRDLLIDLHRRHPSMPPIIIGENGASFPEPDVAGPVEDIDRIAYLSAHIDAVGEALDAGVPVEEYTVWSLLDNWEWMDGYTQRFGLVHVDFSTGERTPKASYGWYQELVAGAHAARTAGAARA